MRRERRIFWRGELENRGRRLKRGGFFGEESWKIEGEVLGREKREFWKNFG